MIRKVLLLAFFVGLGTSITLSQAALGLLTLAWLWRLRDPAARRAVPLAGPVLALAVATLVSALASGAPAASLVSSRSLWLAAALFVTADALPGPTAADRFLTVLALAATVGALVGLAQVALCPGQDPDYGWPDLLYHRCFRARGPFSIYMTLAGVLCMTLVAILPRLVPGGGRPAFTGPALAMLGALVATRTRGAWLGFGAGVLVLVATLRRARPVLIAGLVALVVAVLAGHADLRHRLLTMLDPSEEGVRERFFMWQSGVVMWREHPWLGVGPGGVKRLYASYAPPEAAKRRTGHVHSTPLQILVERGLVGFTAWVWLWVAFFVRTRAILRALRPEDARARALVVGSMAAIVAFLVTGLSEYSFGDSEVVLVAWTLMALPFAAARGEDGAITAPAPLRADSRVP